MRVIILNKETKKEFFLLKSSYKVIFKFNSSYKIDLQNKFSLYLFVL